MDADAATVLGNALQNRSSHVTAPEFRPLFEQAVRDFEAWLAGEDRGGPPKASGAEEK